MGPAKLDSFSNKNGARYEAARKKAAAAKQRRHQKREQLRQSAPRKKEELRKELEAAQRVAPPTLNHAAPPKSKAARSSERKRHVVMDSSDEDVSMASSSESSESSESSDNQPWLKWPAKSRPDGTGLGVSARVPSRPSSPQQRRKSVAGVSTSVDEPSSGTVPSAVTGSRPSIPMGPRDQGPIKIVNGPKQPQRKAWDTQGKHFTTLHYRALAEKRSRAEGTPDVNELEFVNGRPAGISTKSAENTSEIPPYNNPYGRREPGGRRSIIVAPEDEPPATTAGVALQSYEIGKIPMACYDWKNVTCQYGRE